MYTKRGNWFDARRSFLKAVQIAPLSWNAHLLLAESYEYKKEYAKALKEMELTYKLFPDDAVKSNVDRLKQKLINSDGVS
jgi:Tfp pilus assembly protein PilF